MQDPDPNAKSMMLTPGASAVEALAYIVDMHPEITEIRCVEYGRSRRDGKSLPASQQMTARRLRHDVQGRKWHKLPGGDAFLDRLLECIESLPADRALAVTSRVALHGHGSRHIPMVDFRCKSTETPSQKITEWMKEIDSAGGIVLRTTNSFHYYGISLLTDRQWVKFVGRCLLLVPDVDVRYLGHRLWEGWGSLRLSQDPDPARSGHEPEVVQIIEPKRQ